MSALLRFIADDHGVTSVEYGLVAAVLSLAGVVVFPGIASSVLGLFQLVFNALTQAQAG